MLYNGFLSGLSLSWDEFFCQNPLEVIPRFSNRDRHTPWGHSAAFPPYRRSRVFFCSCCPPNVVRFLPAVGDLLYSDDGETVYVHQFMQSETAITVGGKALHLSQRTAYPASGKVRLTLTGGDGRVAVRIPAWIKDHRCDHEAVEIRRGYAFFDLRDGETLTLDFPMRIRLVEARPELSFDCNRCAVMRGPVLYCMESLDNGANLRDIRLSARGHFRTGKHPALGVPTLTVRAYRRAVAPDTPLYFDRTDGASSLVETEAVFIPYYAFANREEAEMQVWHFVKD